MISVLAVFRFVSFFFLLPAVFISAQETPVPIHKAFPLMLEQSGEKVELVWQIKDGYYMYSHTFEVQAGKGFEIKEMNFSKPTETYEDPYFGAQKIYTGSARILLSLQKNENIEDFKNTLDVTYRGCWKKGICYPPKTQTLRFFPDFSAPEAHTASLSEIKTAPDDLISEETRLFRILSAKNYLLILPLFFVAGLLLAFTPCVLPMVPILSGMIAGNSGQGSKFRAFRLSLIYVLSMGLTYTLAGVVVGLVGTNVQILLQQPLFLSVFAGLFFFLSLPMFGLFSFQMPAFISSRLGRLQTRRKDNYIGISLMGITSALIVGPCMAAPLAGILLYLSQTGDAVLGGISLFTMSMGMGMPLILFTVSTDRFLPKTGKWMREINYLWGFTFLFMGLWFLDRFLPKSWMFPSFAGLFFGIAGFLCFRIFRKYYSRWFLGISSVFALSFILYASALTVGFLTGGNNYWNPLNQIAIFQGEKNSKVPALDFQTVKTNQELQDLLVQAKSENRTAIVDFTADWCISCRENDLFFERKETRIALKNAFLIKVDITESNESSDFFYKKFQFFGPPLFLFYDRRGNYRDEFKINGLIKPDKFLKIYRYLNTDTLTIR